MQDNVKIWRDKNGIPHIEAQNESDMYWGQGFVHATDRAMQILLMRILGQGRVSELLDSSEDSLKIDTFFRKMNWTAKTADQISKLTQQEKLYLDSYVAGINDAFAKKVPWEFKLLGYKPEKWTNNDCLMISRMIGYLTLAQSQAEMERLFVEMVQAGVAEEKLEELFPGILGGLDIELLKQVKISERIVPSELLWGIGAPRMMASNNWVISGKKTRRHCLAADTASFCHLSETFGFLASLTVLSKITGQIRSTPSSVHLLMSQSNLSDFAMLGAIIILGPSGSAIVSTFSILRTALSLSIFSTAATASLPLPSKSSTF